MQSDSQEHRSSTPQRWEAALRLRYARQEERTIPVERSHIGPLRVQKGFCPEGADYWHQIIVHPPGGIVGGDRLDVSIKAEPFSHVVLTSPGASKWYRSDRRRAELNLSIDVAPQASIEWLPMESIVFSGAEASLRSCYKIAAGGVLFAADVVCLGRPASAEGFTQGALSIETSVLLTSKATDLATASEPSDELVFFERVRLGEGRGLSLDQLDAPALLGRATAFASLIIVPGVDSEDIWQSLLEQLRESQAHLVRAEQWAFTRLNGLIIGRWRGDGAEAAHRGSRAAWLSVRPLLLGRQASEPRIWKT